MKGNALFFNQYPFDSAPILYFHVNGTFNSTEVKFNRISAFTNGFPVSDRESAFYIHYIQPQMAEWVRANTNPINARSCVEQKHRPGGRRTTHAESGRDLRCACSSPSRINLWPINSPFETLHRVNERTVWSDQWRAALNWDWERSSQHATCSVDAHHGLLILGRLTNCAPLCKGESRVKYAGCVCLARALGASSHSAFTFIALPR